MSAGYLLPITIRAIYRLSKSTRPIFVVFMSTTLLIACASLPTIHPTLTIKPPPVDFTSALGCQPLDYEQVVARGAPSPDGTMFAIGTNFGTGFGIVAAVYDTQTKARRFCLGDNAASPVILAFSADSHLLAVAHSVGGGVEVWQLDSEAHRVFRTAHKDQIYPPVAISPNNKLVAFIVDAYPGQSHNYNIALQVWDIPTGQMIREFQVYSFIGFAGDSQVDVTICVEPSVLCAKSENRRLAIYP